MLVPRVWLTSVSEGVSYIHPAHKLGHATTAGSYTAITRHQHSHHHHHTISKWVCLNAVEEQLKEHVALLVYNTAQPLK